MLALLANSATGFASVTNVCKCTGNQGKAAQQSYYPVDMGNYCTPWDATTSTSCVGTSPPSWCADSWCYTSSQCPGAAAGTYFSAQSGPQLYYNYNVCGATDSYTGTSSDPNASG